MLRLPRISTRTATRLPFTTLFRSRPGVRRRGVQERSRRRLGDADGERRHAGSEDQRDPPTDRIHAAGADRERSEEHTSALQSLMRTSSAVFRLKKKIPTITTSINFTTIVYSLTDPNPNHNTL